MQLLSANATATLPSSRAQLKQCTFLPCASISFGYSASESLAAPILRRAVLRLLPGCAAGRARPTSYLPEAVTLS